MLHSTTQPDIFGQLPFHDKTHIVDGLPIPICTLGRKSSVKRFKGIAAKSYCAAKKNRYFGLKGHLLITVDGVITSFALTPANIDEREAAWDLLEAVYGYLLGDKGYIGKFFAVYTRHRFAYKFETHDSVL